MNKIETLNYWLFLALIVIGVIIHSTSAPDEESFPLTQYQREEIMSRTAHSLEWAQMVRNQR